MFNITDLESGVETWSISYQLYREDANEWTTWQSRGTILGNQDGVVTYGANLTFTSGAGRESVARRIEELVAADSLPFARKKKAKRRRGRGESETVDLEPAITELSLRATPVERLIIDFTTMLVDGVLAKPREVLELLGLDPIRTRVLKRETH